MSKQKSKQKAKMKTNGPNSNSFIGNIKMMTQCVKFIN